MNHYYQSAFNTNPIDNEMNFSEDIAKKVSLFYKLVEQELQKALSNFAGYEVTIDNAFTFLEKHKLVNNIYPGQTDFLVDGKVILSVKFPEFMMRK